MRSVFAALRTLVLPYGVAAGTRIVLDGINGRIDVYNALDDLVTRIDGTGYHLYGPGGTEIATLDEIGLLVETTDGQITLDNAGMKVRADNGGFIHALTLPTGMLTGGGALLALQPADVAGIDYNPGALFANSFPAQDDAPAVQLYSPQILPSGAQSSIVLVGEDDAGNPPTIDHRATGGHRFLIGDVVDAAGMHYLKGQTGREPMSVVAATFKEVTVTFPQPFAVPPTVMTNIEGNSGLYARWGSRAHSVTTTDFVLFVFAVNPSGTAATFNVDVAWTATVPG